MPDCPAADCGYSDDRAHNVAMHYKSKDDDAHSGDYHDAKSELLGEGEQQEEEEDNNGGNNNSTDNSNPSPDKASSLSFPSSNDNSTTSRCPSCGNTNPKDADRVLEDYRSELTADEEELLEEGSVVCTDCQEVFE